MSAVIAGSGSRSAVYLNEWRNEVPIDRLSLTGIGRQLRQTLDRFVFVGFRDEIIVENCFEPLLPCGVVLEIVETDDFSDVAEVVALLHPRLAVFPLKRLMI